MKTAFHFTADKLRDGRSIPKTGKWLVHKGESKICRSGLHYSLHPFDALSHAPGYFLHLVEVDEIVEEQEGKGVCRRRRIIATIDAKQLLRKFARDCALSVYHHWGNEKTDPDGIVLRFLKTGDESIRRVATNTALATSLEYAAVYAAYAAASAASAYAAYTAATYAAYDVSQGPDSRKVYRAKFKRRVMAAFKKEKTK